MEVRVGLSLMSFAVPNSGPKAASALVQNAKSLAEYAWHATNRPVDASIPEARLCTRTVLHQELAHAQR